MPEIAAPTPYRLPQVRYQPRVPEFGPPPQIVPDLSGAAALKGSSAAIGLVADTIAKLPEIITKGMERGRKTAQQQQVHGIKMDALAGRRTPAQIKALEGFQFGEDDSLSYKPVDPVLQQLKYDSEAASVEYRKAAAERARKGTPVKASLYDSLTGAAPDDGLPALQGDGVDGEVLPPLPGSTAVGPELSDDGAPAEPPLPGEPTLDAVAPGSAPVAKAPALAGLGDGTAPLPPAAPVGALAPQPAATTPPDGIVRPKTKGESVLLYRGGKPVAEVRPGANTWSAIVDKPEGMHFNSKEEAIDAGYDISGAIVDQDGGVTVKKIPVAKEQQVSAGLAKEARDLNIPTAGRTPQDVEGDIFKKREVQKLLTPRQFEDLNKIGARMSADVAYKDINNVKQGYLGLLTSKDENSSAGDIALINSFQRIIDPGVSVREGDVALLSNAQGIINKITNLPDVLAGNARLHPDMKASMVAAAHNLYKKRVQNFYDSSGKKFLSQAKAAGLPDDSSSELLGMDFGIPIEGVTVPTNKAPEAPAASAANGKPADGAYIIGKKYRGKDGSSAVYLGGPINDAANWK